MKSDKNELLFAIDHTVCPGGINCERDSTQLIMFVDSKTMKIKSLKTISKNLYNYYESQRNFNMIPTKPPNRPEEVAYVYSRVEQNLLVIRTKDGELVQKSSKYPFTSHGGITNSKTGEVFIYDKDTGYQISPDLQVVKQWKPSQDFNMNPQAMAFNSEKYIR